MGLNFMGDRPLTCRKVRATIADRFSREGLAVDIDFYLASQRVIRTLDEIAAVRGYYPLHLRVDNGPENTAGKMLEWSIEYNAQLHFIDPGKAGQNA
jgi:putative transposase